MFTNSGGTDLKTAIIIGASTGIGRATALALSGKYNSISITSFKHKEEQNFRQKVQDQQNVH